MSGRDDWGKKARGLSGGGGGEQDPNDRNEEPTNLASFAQNDKNDGTAKSHDSNKSQGIQTHTHQRNSGEHPATKAVRPPTGLGMKKTSPAASKFDSNFVSQATDNLKMPPGTAPVVHSPPQEKSDKEKLLQKGPVEHLVSFKLSHDEAKAIVDAAGIHSTSDLALVNDNVFAKLEKKDILKPLPFEKFMVAVANAKDILTAEPEQTQETSRQQSRPSTQTTVLSTSFPSIDGRSNHSVVDDGDDTADADEIKELLAGISPQNHGASTVPKNATDRASESSDIRSAESSDDEKRPAKGPKERVPGSASSNDEERVQEGGRGDEDFHSSTDDNKTKTKVTGLKSQSNRNATSVELPPKADTTTTSSLAGLARKQEESENPLSQDGNFGPQVRWPGDQTSQHKYRPRLTSLIDFAKKKPEKQDEIAGLQNAKGTPLVRPEATCQVENGAQHKFRPELVDKIPLFHFAKKKPEKQDEIAPRQTSAPCKSDAKKEDTDVSSFKQPSEMDPSSGSTSNMSQFDEGNEHSSKTKVTTQKQTRQVTTPFQGSKDLETKDANTGTGSTEHSSVYDSEAEPAPSSKSSSATGPSAKEDKMEDPSNPSSANSTKPKARVASGSEATPVPETNETVAAKPLPPTKEEQDATGTAVALRKPKHHAPPPVGPNRPPRSKEVTAPSVSNDLSNQDTASDKGHSQGAGAKAGTSPLAAKGPTPASSAAREDGCKTTTAIEKTARATEKQTSTNSGRGGEDDFKGFFAADADAPSGGGGFEGDASEAGKTTGAEQGNDTQPKLERYTTDMEAAASNGGSKNASGMYAPTKQETCDPTGKTLHEKAHPPTEGEEANTAAKKQFRTHQKITPLAFTTLSPLEQVKERQSEPLAFTTLSPLPPAKECQSKPLTSTILSPQEQSKERQNEPLAFTSFYNPLTLSPLSQANECHNEHSSLELAQFQAPSGGEEEMEGSDENDLRPLDTEGSDESDSGTATNGDGGGGGEE